MFYTLGIGISFFLSFLLFTKEGHSLADRILASWLVLMGIHLLLFYTFITYKLYDYPNLLGVHFPLPLMHGPFLYLYARAITGRLRKPLPVLLLHFLPALISYAFLIPFFMLTPGEKINVFRNNGAGYETFLTINYTAIILSGITYVVLTLMLHRKHKKNILNQFSYTEKINLDWILYLMYAIALIWIFVLLGNDDLVFGSATFFVLFIGYFGIRQTGIFNSRPPKPDLVKNGPQKENYSVEDNNSLAPNTDPEEEAPAEDESVEWNDGKKKYSKSGLSEETAGELHRRLNTLMEESHLYREPDLSLSELARNLGTHPNHLSQVINEKEGKNFFDYINTLRTREFIRIAADPNNKKFSLLGLAFECGFKSKSSFNKYFKKVTGYSPTEYLAMSQHQDRVA